MENVVRRGIESGGLSRSWVRRKPGWPHWLEQTRHFRSAGNEDVDFCVRERADGFDAIFARVWMGQGAPPSETGLWWCRAERPSNTLSEWSTPMQIMTAEDCAWHSGP